MVSFSEMDENVETLIEEAEKRPAIYDKTLKEYANTNIKKQPWEVVCSAVVSNWKDLEGDLKTKAGKFISSILLQR
jgi:hypothetical protein